ncbi:hypothetical protein NUBL22001_47510 [Klebsiella pneumoniae]|nr:hypothetical protein NUBL22001_47510 [Klebsiella pneumoniae]
MLAAEFTGGYPSFGFAENTDDLFVGKTLLLVIVKEAEAIKSWLEVPCGKDSVVWYPAQGDGYVGMLRTAL